MTTIYVIPNVSPNQLHYVCDSQNTINLASKILQPFCSVGTQADADAMLAANQQALLNQQAELFTVNLQTTVEGGVVWTVVDLNTEPANTDRQYFVLDPTIGQYVEAIGLADAQTLFKQTQQNYLVFNGMASYQIWTSWPVKPIPVTNTGATA